MTHAFLGLAIAAEVIATALLKSTDGFSRLWPTLAVLALYAVSFLGLAHAVRDIPIGVVYAVWAGLGTAGIVILGTVFLGESMTAVKGLGVVLVIGGVVALNLGGAH